MGVGCRVGRNGLVGCWTERRRSPARVMSWEPVRDGSAVWWCGRESIFKICHTNEFCGKSKLARETARASGRLGEPRRTYKRETAPGGAQGELQGRQSQVGRGGSVLVLLLLAFDVCIHSFVWTVVRLVRQKVTLTLVSHGLMRSVGGHVIGHVLS